MLMEAARCTNKSVCRTLRSSSAARPRCPHGLSDTNKRLIVATFNKDRRARPSRSKRLALNKRELKEYPVLPPLPCDVKKDATLVEYLVKELVHIFFIDRFPSPVNQKDSN